MNNREIESLSLKSNSLSTKIITIIIAALLFGFGWHIRGSGTSDPIAPMLMFLLFIGFLFSPRYKFNGLVFGLICIIFRIGRRGWGTFVGQVTGKLEGYDYIRGTEDYIFYSIEVPFLQGYFWLFIVGIAWCGFTALILGGYMFTDKKYNYKDLIICTGLYIVGYLIGLVIAIGLIPIISPDAYYKVYIDLQLDRNYISMRDNFAFAFAVIPVLTYFLIAKKDIYFVKISLIVMLIFGIAFSLADIWQWYGRTNLELGLPFWSLWEYFTGFIIGTLLMVMLYLIPQERWNRSNIEFTFYPADSKLKRFILYLFGHVFLFIYVIAESLNGAFNSSASNLGSDIESSTIYALSIILIIDLPLYYLYLSGKFGNNFKNKAFKDKCLIILILFVPFAYSCYVFQFIVSGTYLNWEISYLVTWLDTFSVIIIEAYLLYLLIINKRRLA